MIPLPANARALTGRPVGSATRWGRLGALTGLLVGTLVAATPVAAQISIEQLELKFTLGSATPTTQSFRINNVSNAPVQVTIRTSDWDRSETGENRYFDVGTDAGSCRDALTIFPMTLSIDAGRGEDVRVSLPASATPCHSLLFVEMPPPAAQANRNGAALTYNLRYGIKVYVEPDAPPAGELTDAIIASGRTADGTRADTLVATFRNTGLVQSIARGHIEIRREDDSIAQRIEVEEFPVLGGARRVIRTPLPVIPAGRYAVILLLEIGTEEILAAQALLEIP
jgi:P pilus assembly chaperone PapD